ncbi:hypothetical protein JR316_0012178 [Psilocybe cubensis]|nr:hypothetical protein JR316_0012178 [Psilocybe cubensis]KAH9475073.1 hypothetical protein JR316_0012178 [Psilocybe cubensis]
MPLFTTVLEDTSPMIIYSSGWVSGSSADSSEDQYSEASFTVSIAKGSTMSISFYGTFFAIIGAKRSNHGPYHATVDGVLSDTFTGKSNTSEFNQTLYSSDTSLGSHNVVLFNDDNTFIDVDYVTFQSSIGEDDDPLIVNTFQDTHPAFDYSPSSSWGIPNNVGSFSGGSGHGASAPGAVLHFSFQVGWVCTRDAVALYGPVGPNSTSYTVKIDDLTPQVLNANKQFYRSHQILFFAGNLGKGEHSLELTLNSPSSGQFAIDFANVYTTPSLGGT